MVRSYKWQPHDEGRHAIPQELAVNHVGHTLCGIEVTAGSDRWPNDARYWPTCNECDLAWRESEGILPWPRTGQDGGPLSSPRPGASTTSSTDSPIDVLDLVIDTLIAQGAHLQTARR
ncbi:zinc finger protein [Lentzea waywayandensis]|uniref:zinc finger protein n=1 Tax=Lentzea waywayandensis TaxID=84724 RepID=UPI000B8945CD|nr:zinc finger protein [Lentzea waywayandensis]